MTNRSRPARSNPRNDRIKRDYLIWFKEVGKRSQLTVDQARHAIDRFEAYTGFQDLKTFNKDQALGFKHALLNQKAARSGGTIAIATVHHILRALREFFGWFHAHEGARCKFKPGDIAYLNLGMGDERRARVSNPKSYPTLAQYQAAIDAMPAGTDVERRDRAVMACLGLTGMRDAALIGLRLRDVDLAKGFVFQDPRHMRTKFAKSIDTFFYPVGDGVRAAFEDWIQELVRDKGFGPDDPVFPKTLMLPNADHAFSMKVLLREHWADAAPVRRIFREAFARTGLTYSKPHTIRDMLTELAYALRLDVVGLKAWSQNMAHDKPLTTLNSYGNLTTERLGEVMGRVGQKESAPDDKAASEERIAELVAAKMKGHRA